MPDITLRVGGQDWAGWKTASVTRGIEAACGSFDLAVSERWADGVEPRPIFEEDECSILIGRKTVLTGYVDRRSPSYTATDHTLALSGRDKPGDLVDCSANPNLEKWEFKGLTVLAFAKKICEPFGISVTLQAGLTDAKLPKPPKKFRIDPGDTAFNAIESACRLAGLLPVSDGAGGLVLTRAGTERATTELIEGENILSASAEFDASGRFRTYRVLGQHKGNDEFNGVSAASVKGSAEDLTVRRASRALIIRPEGSVTVEHAKARAQWEATTRAARAGSVQVTVQGWLQGDGVLWPVNALVNLKSPFLGIDGELLITEANYSVSDSAGSTTRLTLKRPQAFLPEPTIKASSDGLWKELKNGARE